MKGIYLCARKHRIPGYDIDYNDIVDYPGINKLCSCEVVDISIYDYIIATPPCNYYSRSNYRRETSIVAQQTKHLLPYCLELCVKSDKPFLVENVCNDSLLPHEYDIYKFIFGGHTFWSNVLIIYDKTFAIRQNKQNVTRSKRDDNWNVHYIINLFLDIVNNYN